MGITLGDAILHLKADRSELESGLEGAGSGISSWLTRMGAVISGTAIFAAVASGLKRSIEETIAYATEVRQLSSVTGQGAEASSRLLQVFDDFNVSGGQVTTMLRTLASQGLSPTIETIGELSDQYLALEPGVARATFLQDNFGRSGADLAIIMEQGSRALLARNAAVEGGLVLSQRDIDQAEALRQAEDGLGDTWKSVTTTVALFFIPAITAAAGALARNLVSTEQLDRATQSLNLTMARNAPTYEAYVASVREWGEANSELVLTQEEHDELLRRTYPMYDATRGAMVLLTEAERDDALAADDWNRSEEARLLLLSEGPQLYEAERDAVGDLIDAVAVVPDMLAAVDAGFDSTLAAFLRTVATMGDGVLMALQGRQAEIRAALTAGLITPDQAAELGQEGGYAYVRELLATGVITPAQANEMAQQFGFASYAALTAWAQAHPIEWHIQGVIDYPTVPTQAQLRAEVRGGSHGSMEGMQRGGAFDVGGPSGADQNLVQFVATRGEHVEVTPAGEQPRGPQYPVTFNVYVNNRDDLQALEQSVMQIFRGV
jgi:hypothetical protein